MIYTVRQLDGYGEPVEGHELEIDDAESIEEAIEFALCRMASEGWIEHDTFSRYEATGESGETLTQTYHSQLVWEHERR